MRNYIKHIDDFFREKLGSYTETPPPDVWDELEGRLDGLKPQAPGHSYRWVWHVAMVSLILLLGVSLTKRIINNAGKNNQDIALNTASNTQATNTATTANTGNSATAGEKATPQNNNGKQNDNNNPGNNNGVNNSPATVVAANTGNSNTQQASNPANNNKAKTGKTSAGKQQSGNALAKHTAKAKAGKTVAGNSSKATGHGPNAEEDQPANEYNSAANNGSAKNKTGNSNTVADKKQPEELPVAAKKVTTPVAKTNVAKNDAAKQTDKNRFIRLEAGVKVGYERGVNDAVASKGVISPYLQYNISPKLSVMVQPGVKYANMPKRDIADKSYYQANDDGIVGQNSQTIQGTGTGGTYTIVSVTTNYTATQSHDSIVKSYHYGGSYMEYELPILLKYKLSKTLSVYGGIGLEYSQMTNITESTYTVNGLQRTVTEDVKTQTIPTQAPPVGYFITYNGTPIKNYNGALYTAPQQGVLRVGYTLGFSYEYNKKWLLDALTQISPVKPITKGGYDINTPLSSPYFRLSVGYKLTK